MILRIMFVVAIWCLVNQHGTLVKSCNEKLDFKFEERWIQTCFAVTLRLSLHGSWLGLNIKVNSSRQEWVAGMKVCRGQLQDLFRFGWKPCTGLLRHQSGRVLRRMRSVAFIVYFETGGPCTLLKPNRPFHCEESFAPLSQICLFSLNSNLSDVRAEDQVPQHQSQRSEREVHFLQRWSDNRTRLLRALKGDRCHFDNDGSQRKGARPLVNWFRRETTKPEKLHGKSGLL